MAGNCPIALFVGIDPVILARRLSIESHSIAHGFSIGPEAEDEMQIARVESKPDAPTAGDIGGCFALNYPAAGERPLVQRKLRGRGVGLRAIVLEAIGRSKVLCALIANV